MENFRQERLQAIGNSASLLARLAALDMMRSFEDRTRKRFHLDPLTRASRPPRPVTTGHRGGIGRGMASGRISGRGRGRGQGRASGINSESGNDRGPAPTNGHGACGRGAQRGRGQPLLLASPQSWGKNALSETLRAPTDSWLYVPLLLDAFGVQRPFTFVRPPRWEVCVEC